MLMDVCMGISVTVVDIMCDWYCKLFVAVFETFVFPCHSLSVLGRGIRQGSIAPALFSAYCNSALGAGACPRAATTTGGMTNSQ